MKTITTLSLLLLSIATIPGADTATAEEWGQDRSIDQLSESVYRWGSGADNSAFIVTSEGIIVIDGSPCASDDTEWIKGELEQRYDVPVRYVVLSHDHASHICGTEVFSDTAVTIGHRKILPHILREGRPSAIPDITFEDFLDINLGGVEVVLLYYGPTHSDNLIQVHIPEEEVLIAVDMSRAGKTLIFPDFRDMDVNNTIDVLGILARLDNVEIVLPGHGQAATQETFSIYRDYLRTLRDRVLEQMVDGKSVEEVLQIVTMDDFSDFGFHDRWLRPNILSMYDYLYRYREPNEDTLREYQQSHYPIGD
jgi:glyoxylase-like metal-dependent hydrolase (beta-lactamase superfamily II)